MYQAVVSVHPNENFSLRIVFDTVEWECGVDIDPEFVRAKCRRVKRT
jgi:hypothetical protein